MSRFALPKLCIGPVTCCPQVDVHLVAAWLWLAHVVADHHRVPLLGGVDGCALGLRHPFGRLLLRNALRPITVPGKLWLTWKIVAPSAEAAAAVD